VAGTIEIQLPRVPDRDRLLASLRRDGFEAQPVERDGHCALSVSRRGDGRNAKLIEAVEQWIAESGAPLVPEQLSNDTCLLRPFGD